MCGVLVNPNNSPSSSDRDIASENLSMQKTVQLEKIVGEFEKEIQKKNEEIFNLNQLFEAQSNEVNQLKLAATEKDWKSLASDVKGAKCDKQDEANEYDEPVLIPGLQEVISSNDTISLVKYLLLKLNKSSAAYREFKCVMNEKCPLTAATKFGCINLIALLLTNGLPVDQNVSLENLCGGHCNMLHVAAEHEHRDLCHLLLLCGADYNISVQAFPQECVDHTYECIDIFKITNKDQDAKLFRQFKKTILFCLIRNKNIETVKSILVEDASIITLHGLMLLKTAVKWRNTEILHFLIENGAHLNKNPEELRKLLYTAIRTGQREIVNILLSDSKILEAEISSGMTSIHYAARLGHVDVVQELLQKGADVNKRNFFNKTPLYYAQSISSEGCRRVVQCLQSHISSRTSSS